MSMGKGPRFMERPPRLPPPPAAPFALPRPTRFSLENGLQVLHLQRGGLPLIHVALTLRCGHTADLPGEVGAAFVTAALVDEGAGSRSALQIAGDLQEMGTALHITVDADSTSLTLDLLRDQLEPALSIVADVVRRPHLDPRELERVQQELVGRAEERRASPNQVAGLALAAAVFGDAPHGRPALPRPADVAAVRRAQVRRFHRAHYRPDNALLVVAGAIGRAELERLVRRLFGRWRPGAAPQPRGARPPGKGPRLVLVRRAGAAESVIRAGHRLPSRRQVDPVRVELLNAILGGSFTSRLNLNLRERHGFTYGAGSSFNLMRRHGLFSVEAQVARGVTLAALREVLKELRGVVRRPVGQRELAKARALVAEELPASAESLAGLADAYLDLALYGESLSGLNRLPVRLARTSPADIHRLARQLVFPEAATLVVVGDIERLAPDLRRAFGPAHLFDADGLPLDPDSGLSTLGPV